MEGSDEQILSFIANQLTLYGNYLREEHRGAVMGLDVDALMFYIDTTNVYNINVVIPASALGLDEFITPPGSGKNLTQTVSLPGQLCY